MNKVTSSSSKIQMNCTLCSAIFDETKWNVEVLFKRMCRHTVEIAEKAVASFETGRMYMPQYIMLPDEITKYGTRHNMFCNFLPKDWF